MELVNHAGIAAAAGHIDHAGLAGYVLALVGGALIGLAASVAWLGYGRIAGVSGILGRALVEDDGHGFRMGFLEGMIGVGVVVAQLAPTLLGRPLRGTVALAVAGLLVGIGTTLANGCTSGHGVCGLARVSSRSAVAVATFMIAGGITVALAGVGS